jgi:hypothetical protein
MPLSLSYCHSLSLQLYEIFHFLSNSHRQPPTLTHRIQEYALRNTCSLHAITPVFRHSRSLQLSNYTLTLHPRQLQEYALRNTCSLHAITPEFRHSRSPQLSNSTLTLNPRQLQEYALRNTCSLHAITPVFPSLALTSAL